MRRMMIAALGLVLGVAGSNLAGTARAETATQGPGAVVVELYTSQGCSSCPPADALLSELAEKPNVIALALHVDYWDYIGWKDNFGSPDYTARQKAYARAIGSRTIYTPQMIVEGVDRVEGFRPMQVADLIHHHRAQTSPVSLQIQRQGGVVHIVAQSAEPLSEAATVQLVRYRPEATVQIRRGENAGRTLTYHNIVTHWETLRDWDGRSALSLTAPAKGEQPVVVIVQRKGPGEILAAARVE
ncbi:DUF1223 domain-containing protein [Acidimangrovimonas pyrenivorans]|uniref:DUF1223 domain-containing protein n=2 Tax=Acidimangrovimonas pyrenivorans TaxID=2030798 RepID=A0ABV7AJY7_9RHOB